MATVEEAACSKHRGCKNLKPNIRYQGSDEIDVTTYREKRACNRTFDARWFPSTLDVNA